MAIAQAIDELVSALSMRTSHPKPTQILLGLSNVSSDLFLKRFYRRKLDLIAQAVEKVELDFGLRRKLERVKIQQVGFYGKRIGPKGWPLSHVRDRIEALDFMAAADPRPCDVYAILRNQFFIVRQIDSGDRIFRPISAAPAGSGEKTERTPQ